ncbi:MAG: PAS domain S-box protein [Planctomycetaceae bacterium]|nr:PAS domain S-box protein [Planctomycetaceae bacterium]
MTFLNSAAKPVPEQRREFSSWPSRWAWLPIPVMLGLMLIFWIADLQTGHESPLALMALNFVFSTLASLAVAFIAARGFLAGGSPGMLLLACGVLIWGLGSATGVVAEVDFGLGRMDGNGIVTIHNICVWISALCHLAGVALLPRDLRAMRSRGLWLGLGVIVAAGMVAAVAGATLAGWFPVFFVQGVGGTLPRQVMLGSAISIFVVSASLLRAGERETKSSFAYWYALALVLLATGLAGVMIQSVKAGWLGWTGRAAQFLGGAYMLAAAIAALRGSSMRRIGLDVATGQARHQYIVAVMIVVASAAVRLTFLQKLGTEAPFVVFFPAIVLAALYGGFGPGITATILSALMTEFFWIEPVGQFSIGSAANLLIMGIFIVGGIMISGVTEALLRAHTRARGELNRRTVQALPAHIAVLDARGRIVAVNHAWTEFAQRNAAGNSPSVAAGADYLQICRRAATEADDDAARALSGIEAVLSGRSRLFTMEYPCHSPSQERWFHMTAVPLEGDDGGAVITHLDITHRKEADEALRESWRQQDLLFQSAADGVVMHEVMPEGSYGSFIQANPAICRMLGYTHEEMRGLSPVDILPPGQKVLRPQERDILAQEGGVIHEKVLIAKDGRQVPAEITSQVLHHDGKRMAVSVIRDITDRKQAEENLRTENRQFELANRVLRAFAEDPDDVLFDRALAAVQEDMNSAHGIFGYIAEPGHLICPSLSRILGACEVAGKCIHYPPEKWKGLWARALKEKRSIYTNEAPPVPPGHVIIHNNLAAPILFQGEPVGLLNLANKEGGYTEEDRRTLEGIAARIAPVLYAWIQRKLREDDRKQAQQALLQAKEDLERRVAQRTAALVEAGETLKTERQRLYDVLETLPANVVLLTADHRFVFANRHFKDRFGQPNGKRCYELFQSRSEPCDDCQTFVPMKTHAPNHWKRTAADGRDYDVSDFPFTDTDGTPLVMEMGIDVTERNCAERALRGRTDQLRALASELTLTEQRERRRLAEVLHDGLQQLLVGAKFRLAMLERSTDPAIRTAVAGIDELVSESIQTSRSLTAELSPPILYEGGLVAALEWLARWMQDKHALTVDIEAPQVAPELCEEVTVLLFQATRELLFNIVKHAGVSSAAVKVTRSDGTVTIHVADQGNGFDADALRAQGRTAGGFGLFSISERIDLLGGRMEVDSAPRQGSRFTLTAPVAASCPLPEPQKAHARMSAVIPPRAKAHEGRIRVVLVDDHNVMRQGLAALLREEADMVIVGEAGDGHSAVQLVQQVHPDVVLMDISLPGMNGIEATRMIHSQMPHVHIIGLSMFEKVEQAAAMRAAGASDYLTKSGASEALAAAIRACVGPRN